MPSKLAHCLCLQIIDSLLESFVVSRSPAHLYEGPHDCDVRGYGSAAAKDTRKHRDPLLGEDVGEIATTAMLT